MPWNNYRRCLDLSPYGILDKSQFYGPRLLPRVLTICKPYHGEVLKSLCQISGTGMTGATVRITVDNHIPVYKTVGSNGRWSINWEDIGWLDNGVHSVKVEHLDPPYGNETEYTYVTIKDAPSEPYSVCDGAPQAPDTSCGCNLRFLIPNTLNCVNEPGSHRGPFYRLSGYNATPGADVCVKVYDTAAPQHTVWDDCVSSYSYDGMSGYWELIVPRSALEHGRKYRIDVCEEGTKANGDPTCYKASSKEFTANGKCNIYHRAVESDYDCE